MKRWINIGLEDAYVYLMPYHNMIYIEKDTYG